MAQLELGVYVTRKMIELTGGICFFPAQKACFWFSCQVGGAVLKNVSETHGMCLDMGIHIGASENRKKKLPNGSKWH